MDYSELVEIYEKLESTSGKLDKTEILANFFRRVSEDELASVVLLATGSVYTKKDQKELGIAGNMMKKIIEKVCGVSDINKKYKETGDLGLTAAFFLRNKRQQTLGKKSLTVDKVMANLRKLPEITGAGTQDRKSDMVSELLSSAKPGEALYLVRTILGELRIGVAEGIVRDAIAKAFDAEPKEVEHAYNMLNSYGLVAELAKKKKLGKAEMRIGEPIRVMLADRAPDLKTALGEFEEPALETKYDGFRVQIHKSGSDIKLFSRRMEDVTKQFPELADWSKKQLNAKQCIVEGEVLAIGKDGRSLPFQQLSRRIQRKYDIERMVKEITIEMNLFELLSCEGTNYMGKPLKDRWHKLKSIVSETKHFKLAKHLETKDLSRAEKFYEESLGMGQEGVIVKNLAAQYQPGKRVGYWLKVKPIMETLDLMITGGEWGTGKRAGALGTLVISARSGSGFASVGMIGSGFKEKTDESKDKEKEMTLGELTKMLKPHISEGKGSAVTIKPKVVIEVAYEEIQRSPKYPSGFALRFPRLVRIRSDKGPDDADSVERVRSLFNQQRGRG